MDGLDGFLKNAKCPSSLSTTALEKNPAGGDLRSREAGQAGSDLAAVPSPLGSPHGSVAGAAGFSGSGGRRSGT